MRVGTISLNINTHDLNYGAVLHSWAFQQLLRKMECVSHTEVIDYVTPRYEAFNLKYPVLSYMSAHAYRAAASSALKARSHAARFNRFAGFIGQHMEVSKESYTQRTLNDATLEYDVVICESDVIWSHDFFGDESLDVTFFLGLDSMRTLKKIAYAPSLANGRMTDERKAQLRRYLEYPDAISCRERYGAEILQGLTDKPVAAVLDPTLLLDKGDYKRIVAPPQVDGPYVLVYFPLKDNPEILSAASAYARRRGAKVVEVSAYWYHSLRRRTMASASIPEWLSLVMNATCVFTDSLHAVCFSLVFNVDFFVFPRATGRKTEDLCGRFGLTDRYVLGDSAALFGDASTSTQEIDWEAVNGRRKKMADHSVKWLADELAKPNLGGGVPR